MAEQTTAPEIQSEQLEQPEVVRSEMEQQAIEMGWRPKEEYEGDPGKWVTAEIFVARAPLFDKIEQQSRALKDTQRVLEELRKHNSRIEEASYKKALETLKEERKAALAEENFVKAEEIRDQIDEIKSEQAKVVMPQAVPTEMPPQLVEWQNNNQWYKSDKTLTAWADGRGAQLLKEGVSPPEILKVIATEVKEAFPNKFRNPKREQGSPVETSGGVQSRTSSKSDNIVLTPEETQAMNRFIRLGVLTKEQYLADIKKTRG